MKLLKREHWLVTAIEIAVIAVFLFVFAMLVRSELAQTYALETWSLAFLGVVTASALLAYMAAGVAMNFGFILASAIYCVLTHDRKHHWLGRTIVSAKLLIDRPRWAVDYGL